MVTTKQPPQTYQWCLIIVMAKLFLVSAIPITGDEAYFLTWGKSLLAGYYDHPPMIGWISYLLGQGQASIVTYRLFSITATALISYLIYQMACLYVDVPKAKALAVLFFISPVSLLASLYSNDIPLALFSCLSVTCFLYAIHQKHHWLVLTCLSGIFLGLAFLSKYFAALLALGMILLALKQRKGYKYMAIGLLCFIPFLYQNLWFNYHHCWSNLVFNLVSRTQHSHFHWSGIFIFAGTLLYLLTPWGAYLLYQQRVYSKHTKLYQHLRLLLVPTGIIFFIVSLKNNIGLHWFLSFTPFLYLSFAGLSQPGITRLTRWTFLFTLVHIAMLVITLCLPLHWFQHHKKYNKILLHFSPAPLCQQLPKNTPLYSFSYSLAAIVEYHCKRTVVPLFNESKYGRQGDNQVNLNQLQSQTLFFLSAAPQIDKLTPYFKQIEQRALPLYNSHFYLIKAIDFNAKQYQASFHQSIVEKFYQHPKWLPNGHCPQNP